MLIDDKDLYNRYLRWWETKRRDFLAAMRGHMVKGGIESPVLLFTGTLAEAGVGLGPSEPILPTDVPEKWQGVVAPKTRLATPQQVADEGLYLKSMLTPRGNWGNWEWHHSGPADDPLNYSDVDGVIS